MRFFGETHIDFIGLRKIAFIISGIAIGAGLISLGVKGGPKLGLDFTGGIEIHLKFEKSPSIVKIRSALSKIGLGGAVIQQYGRKGENTVLIRYRVEKISQRLASNILKYREKKGKFTNLNELKQIPNIELVGYENLTNILTLKPSSPGKINLNEADQATLNSVIRDIYHRKIANKIEKAVEKEFGKKNPFEVRSINLIGPKVSEELKKDAILAVILSLIGMLVYIAWRFELRFAVGAVTALVHDILVTVGALSLGNYEFTLPIIAALLTIVGYSLNDTIVIYARIKENMKTFRKKKGSFKDILNLGINQSLSRTIITSLTTFVVVIVLFLLGGAPLHGFTFALLVGIITGTYSSDFIATPVVYAWEKGKK